MPGSDPCPQEQPALSLRGSCQALLGALPRTPCCLPRTCHPCSGTSWGSDVCMAPSCGCALLYLQLGRGWLAGIVPRGCAQPSRARRKSIPANGPLQPGALPTPSWVSSCLPSASAASPSPHAQAGSPALEPPKGLSTPAWCCPLPPGPRPRVWGLHQLDKQQRKPQLHAEGHSPMGPHKHTV